MILNSNDYSIQKPYIKNWIDAKAKDSRFNIIDEIGPLAIATNTHIVIVTHFLIELYGDNIELEEKKKRFMTFYRIDEVI